MHSMVLVLILRMSMAGKYNYRAAPELLDKTIFEQLRYRTHRMQTSKVRGRYRRNVTSDTSDRGRKRIVVSRLVICSLKWQLI